MYSMVGVGDHHKFKIEGQAQVDGGLSIPGAASFVRPIGGNILAHAITTRVMVRKGKENTRTMKLVDSPSLPERPWQSCLVP